MPPVVESAAYHLVSEALTNAARHAHATVVHVQTAIRDADLHLSIRDDGAGGADHTAAPASPASRTASRRSAATSPSPAPPAAAPCFRPSSRPHLSPALLRSGRKGPGPRLTSSTKPADTIADAAPSQQPMSPPWATQRPDRCLDRCPGSQVPRKRSHRLDVASPATYHFAGPKWPERSEVPQEPVASLQSGGGQSAGFVEQVRGAGHDDQVVRQRNWLCTVRFSSSTGCRGRRR